MVNNNHARLHDRFEQRIVDGPGEILAARFKVGLSEQALASRSRTRDSTTARAGPSIWRDALLFDFARPCENPRHRLIPGSTA